MGATGSKRKENRAAGQQVEQATDEQPVTGIAANLDFPVDRYNDVDAILGAGATAVVYRAYSVALEKRVAVKTAARGSAADKICFKRDIEILNECQHDNVIQLIEFFTTPTLSCIAMELAPNGTLYDKVYKSDEDCAPKARYYYRQLVEGVNYLHNKRIVHRDLKLENVALDLEDKAKILDFGLACRVRRPEDTEPPLANLPLLLNSIKGSRAYMCIELLRKSAAAKAGRQTPPYNPLAADVWATGVILYELVFKNTPSEDACEPEGILTYYERGLSLPDCSDKLFMLLRRIFKPENLRCTIGSIQQCDWLKEDDLQPN